MNTIMRLCLWTGVMAALLLPALSNVGYTPDQLEYLTVLLASLLAGAACIWMMRMQLARCALLVLLVLLPTAIYYETIWLQNTLLMMAPPLIALGLSWLAWRHFSKALILAGLVAWSQVFAAAIMTPGHVLDLKEQTVKRSNLPAVVHLIMDEHGSMSAIPRSKVAQEALEKFEEDYVRRGFIVFSKAYTADNQTVFSLARLFNVNRTKKVRRTLYWGAGRWGATPNRGLASLAHASVLDTIGKKRALDVTQIRHVNFDATLRKNKAVARKMSYNVLSVSGLVSSLSYRERLQLAKAVTIRWFTHGLQSKSIRWLLRQIGWPDLVLTPHAMVSRQVMQELGDRLARDGHRGTYYLAHLLLPHHPYVLDETCRPLPLDQWNRHAFDNYFTQTSCAKQSVFELVDRIRQNPKLKDAVILVHGDHGSKVWWANRFTRRASFLAIHIPGKPGARIDQPVRLDAFYANLLKNNFADFRMDDIKSYPDSPYR